MKRLLFLTVLLIMFVSVSASAFVSDFEDAEVILEERWSEVVFSFLDGWFARVGISDSRAAEVLSVYEESVGVDSAFQGGYMMGVVIYDTSTTEPIGAMNWDVNSRPGEGGVNHFTSVTTGDTITFNVWIPPKGAIDTQLVFRPYSQYLDWSVWDADSIGIDSIYANEGLVDGGWRAFNVVLPDTVGGGDILAVGLQFEYPDTVNPDDTIYIDLIHSTDYSGIAIPAGDEGTLSLPKSSINKLQYEISTAAEIHIDVYSVSGQKVKEIFPGAKAAGTHSLDVDVAPGVYVYKVTAGKNSKSSKLIILK